MSRARRRDSSAVPPPASPFTWMWIAIVGVLAVSQRVAYYLATDPLERAYDPTGHIDYVKWVADHLTIPLSKDGWEFYQPPSYYYLAGGLLRTVRHFIADETLQLRLVQLFSLAMAIAMVLIGLWILWSAGKKLHTEAVALGAAIMAFMPSHVMLGTLIGNDTQVTLLSFAAIALLYFWWTSRRDSAWYGAILCIGVAIITKSNGYLLIPFAGILFLLQPRLTSPANIKRGLIGAMILLLVAGWYPVYRVVYDANAVNAVEVTKTPAAALITNLTNLHINLKIENKIMNFVTFQPQKFIPITYNDPWKDESRRQFFWEYFYRSMLVLDHDQGPMMRWASINLLLLGLVLLPLALNGVVIAARRDQRSCLFFLLLGVILLGGHIAIRILAPYSSTQVFRYSIPLLLSLGYFCAWGLEGLPTPLRQLCTTLVICFCYFCLAFSVSFLMV